MIELVFRGSVEHEMGSSDAGDGAVQAFARETTDRFIERGESVLSGAGIKHVVEVYSVSTCYGVGSPVESEVAVHVEYGAEGGQSRCLMGSGVEVSVCEVPVGYV